MATKDQLIASAQKNLEKGQTKKAIKDYQQLLALEPKVDQHKQKLADLLCRVNLKEDALSLYESLAKSYAERGFAAKAVAVYKQMQRIDPANPDLYLRLAELNRGLGLIGNAMSEYRNLLEFYENRKMVTETASVLQKMVELDPENINLQLRVLQHLLKEKLYDRAKETITKACEVCANSGDSVKSQKILQSILSHLPENNEFHLEIASKLTACGLNVDAIYLYQYLLKSSPRDPLILNELVTLYGKINDAENEILLLEQLIVVQLTAEAVERLVRLCIATGDHVRALRVLEEHELTLDDENHSRLVDLYREIEKHLPGDKRVRSAIVRYCGADALLSADDEVLTSSPDVFPLEDTSEDFSLGFEEFGLDDLLSLPCCSSSSEAISLPAEEPLQEDVVEEEVADVSIELPDEGISFDDIDTFDVPSELSFSSDAVEDDITPAFVDIDFDFGELATAGSEAEVTTKVELEVEGGIDELEIDLSAEEFIRQIETSDIPELTWGAGVLNSNLAPSDVSSSPEININDDIALSLVDIDSAYSENGSGEEELEVENGELEVDLSAEDLIRQIETSDTSGISRNVGALNIELSLQKESSAQEDSIQAATPLPLNDIDYDFGELAEIEEEIEEGVDVVDIEDSEVDLLDEIDLEDEEEILELEPLEEEKDDLGAELAALEDLLDAEMVDLSPEEQPVFKVAADEFTGNVSSVDDDFFDLAAEILDEGDLQATEDLAKVDDIDRFRFDSVFSEFKKGVDAQIDHEDTEAHYDLGIAYKEMGLMDDAIEEFKKSMHSLRRLADSLILIGICYAEKGAFADAEAVFSTAIARPEVQEADKVGTQYELGLVYEVWGRPADALRTFEAVAINDPSFRNVGEKIEALRLQVSAGSSQSIGATPESASPGKNRVSFV